MQLVQSLDRALHHRRLNSPPDRCREYYDVGVEHLLENSRPLVALAHVAPGTGLDVVIGEANDLAGDVVRAETFDDHLAQRCGVREFLSGPAWLEGRKQEDRL